ncbi:MAG: PepSY-associated TM helix domain-containing protein, partial [Vicinamibacterales bacterium]
MRLRSILFWLHLACGVIAGVVILMMSVTGVLLTYQRQITAWADTRGYRIETGPQRLPADALVASVLRSRPELSPTAIVIRSEPSAPASLMIGAGRQLFVDPYTGAVLGEGNGQNVRAFFRVVVEWHRYVAASGASRPLGRAVTGAANLAFLLIVMSGLFLWWPRAFNWTAFRNVAWFKGGL